MWPVVGMVQAWCSVGVFWLSRERYSEVLNSSRNWKLSENVAREIFHGFVVQERLSSSSRRHTDQAPPTPSLRLLLLGGGAEVSRSWGLLPDWSFPSEGRHSLPWHQHDMLLLLILQYMNDAGKWKELLEGLNVPDTIPELEESIHQHQTLIENITQAYTEVRTVQELEVAIHQHQTLLENITSQI